jgi:hypothetical protein
MRACIAAIRPGAVANVTAISPGQSVNVAFNPLSDIASTLFKNPKLNLGKVTHALISIRIRYYVDIFGVISLPRNPPETQFTWFSGTTNPRWIRGDFDMSPIFQLHF